MTSLFVCWKCGKEAFNVCGRCKDALYCSEECHSWDWKTGGHKTLCKGPGSARKIHIILRELFVLEYDWLNRLSKSEKRTLYVENQQHEPLNHLFLSGEVAKVLARASAAAILGNSRKQHTNDYGSAFYAAVIFPWYIKHKKFLNEQGFFVEYIVHCVYLSDGICGCLENGVPCGNLAIKANHCALIKDVRNPKSRLVNKVFLEKRPSTLEEWKAGQAATSKDVMECTSFRPTRDDDEEDNTRMTAVFAFANPNQVFGVVGDFCCSPSHAIPFNIHPEDAVGLGEFFRHSRKAFAKIGFPVVLKLSGGTDEAVADTWLAAAGDLSTFNSWMEKEPSEWPVSTESSRVDNILNIVFAKN